MASPKLPLPLIAVVAAPMHRQPDPLAEQISQGLLGMAVEAEETRGDWKRIRTPDGYSGWIQAALVASAPEDWSLPPIEIVDLWANLRPAPDYRLAASAQAMVGTHLPAIDRETGWVGVRHPDGRKLWVEEHRVRSSAEGPRPAAPTALIRTARRFLGVPYLWGGCTPLGIDCSGFTQLVMRLHGIPLLRDACLQADQGEPCPTPEAADLVFFGPPSGEPRITHVGMMLDASRFIHAKGSDQVRIDRLEGHTAHNYLLARRFIAR